VVARIGAGQSIKPAAVRSIIADAKEQEHKAKEAAKKTPEQRQREKERCLSAEQIEMFRQMIAGIPRYKLGEPLSSMR
jgi:hypothetical protein